ncbi:MAG TPA: DUF2256 domain-containing protein [Verrucomicrobiales bacterium]|nr:DUF2256 domain-containing protein [Verrucomicrobiales bacterium]
MRKENLPVKLCSVCQRPFAWRKKWEKVWNEVRYCGEACRRKKVPSNSASPPTVRPVDSGSRLTDNPQRT